MKVFSLLLFLFIPINLIADDRGIIEFSSKQEVVVGEIQQAKMLLISNDNSQLVIENLTKQTEIIKIGDDIEVISIQNVKISENNNDVVESDILVLFKNSEIKMNPVLEIMNHKYIIEFRNLKLKKLKKAASQHMMVADTFYSMPFERGWVLCILLFLLIAVLCFSVRFILKYKIKRTKYLSLINKKNFWHNLFMNSHDRNQFEFIIQNFNRCKEDLSEIYIKSVDLLEKKKLLETFYNNNIELFYQRNWEQETQKKVEQSFNLVRDIFNGEFRI